MDDLLFVYGTLLDEHNKYGVYIRDNSRFYAPATLKGKLYDIGEYPGAVLDPGGDDMIHGILLRMDDPETALALLDIYEGYGEDHPQPNEFVRLLVDAETEKGPVTCWIYLYNLPIGALSPIVDGRYFK